MVCFDDFIIMCYSGKCKGINTMSVKNKNKPQILCDEGIAGVVVLYGFEFVFNSNTRRCQHSLYSATEVSVLFEGFFVY